MKERKKERKKETDRQIMSSYITNQNNISTTVANANPMSMPILFV